MEYSQYRNRLFYSSLKNFGHITVLMSGPLPNSLLLTIQALGADLGNPGDIEYNFKDVSIRLREHNEWRKLGINSEKISHPSMPNTHLSFDELGFPTWSTRNVDNLSKNKSVHLVLESFGKSHHVGKILAEENPNLSKRRTVDDDSEQLRKKKVRTNIDQHWQMSKLQKDPLRFVASHKGFPKDAPTVRWRCGITTFLPVVGCGTSFDVETESVLDMASRPTLHFGTGTGTGTHDLTGTHDFFPLPKENSKDIDSFVAVIELEDEMKRPEHYTASQIQEATLKLVEFINRNLGESKAVVVRGWKPEVPVDFSETSLELVFGNQRQPVHYFEGFKFARNRDLPEIAPYHTECTLKKFVQDIDDETISGNWLDSKNLQPNPPSFITPLLDNIYAWNQTFRLGYIQKANQKGYNIEDSGPRAVRSANWSSPGWRLVSHPGVFTQPHNDCCGLATYVVANHGCKIWSVMVPKTVLGQKPEMFLEKIRNLTKGKGYDCDMVTVILEENDVMIQPPALTHMVYTPVPSIFTGGYFFNYETMHLTKIIRYLRKQEEFTNDKRGGSFRTLCRMMIALKYRSGRKIIGKRSLLSLCLMILQSSSYKDKDDAEVWKGLSQLQNEEAGDLAFAKKCAQSVLDWLKISSSSAEKYLEGGDIFDRGELVELPDIDESTLLDPVFRNL